MRKFKLVSKYPGSLELGNVVEEVEGYGYIKERLDRNAYKMYPNAFIPKSYVEDQPEFWEEVVEKNYEITALYIENLYDSSPSKIEEVKRLSDGEKFRVGDKYTILSGTHTIGALEEDNSTIIVISDDNLTRCSLDFIEKVKKLLTTEDGVDVYEGDVYWAGYVEAGISSFYPSEWAGNSTNMKYFSTKEAAEEYINKRNITFTLEEVVKIVNNWSMSRVDEGDILRFYEKIKK